MQEVTSRPRAMLTAMPPPTPQVTDPTCRSLLTSTNGSSGGPSAPGDTPPPPEPRALLPPPAPGIGAMGGSRCRRWAARSSSRPQGTPAP